MILHRARLAMKGRIPQWMKASYLSLRQLNASSRALPDFLIIGAMKAGTTSLFNYLCQHPQVIGSVPKEIHYFAESELPDEYWYRRHFPMLRQLEKQKAICGEASPEYLYSSIAAERAARMLNAPKFIVILREPAARAVSHYYHRVRAGRETRQVNEVFSAEAIRRLERNTPEGDTERLLLERSLYAKGIRHWLKYFSKEQLLLLEAERLFKEPAPVLTEVVAFLGLDSVSVVNPRQDNQARYSYQKPDLFANLVSAFDGYNADLAQLGYAMSWMRQQS